MHETENSVTYFAKKSNSKHHLTKILTSILCIVIFITEK